MILYRLACLVILSSRLAVAFDESEQCCPNTKFDLSEEAAAYQRQSTVADADDPSSIRKHLQQLIDTARRAQSDLQAGIDAATHVLEDGATTACNLHPLTSVATSLERVRLELELPLQAGVSMQPAYQMSGRTIAKRIPVWPDFFTFEAAVRADSQLLSSTVIRRSPESPPRFVVLGDTQGKIYFFLPSGKLAKEHSIGNPVTALLSHQPRSNLTVLLAGLWGGQVQLLEIHQSFSRSAAYEENVAIEKIEYLRLLEGAKTEDEATNQLAVRHMALIPAGARHGFQYVAVQEDGTISIYRADEHEVPIIEAPTTGCSNAQVIAEKATPLAKRFDLHHKACRGLNGSSIQAATFQHTRGSLGRYLAITGDGELLTLATQILTDCKVLHRSSAMLPVLDTAAMSALPGYLLLETSQVAAAFNTSGPLSRRGPLGLVATSLSAAASVAGLMGNRQVIRPLLVTASPNLLVMSLRDDVVGFFSVSMPTETKTVGPPLLAWARPVIIAIVALIVIWHFGNKRPSTSLASRSSELFRDQAFPVRATRDHHQNPTMQPYMDQSSAFRRGSDMQPSSHYDLDQRMAAEVEEALANRRQSRLRQGTDQSVSGTQQKALENMRIMGEVEEAIRRRKVEILSASEAGELPGQE